MCHVNYRPISNLSVVSKIIERIVKSRLTDHLSSNTTISSILISLSYCKHHSTETALSYIHDRLHLISAIGSQKLSCLCLLDLSAAFDTIDHNILDTRLSSWFGIHGSVLNWFKCRVARTHSRYWKLIKFNMRLRHFGHIQ